ncbi:uncharacterized protein ISCGN_016962 [Ixodes scapularis]
MGIISVAVIFVEALALIGHIGGASKRPFNSCDVGTSAITIARAASYGSRILQQCMEQTVMKYKLPSSVVQKGLRAVCIYLRFCYHKYKPLMDTERKKFEYRMHTCVANLTAMSLEKFTEDISDEVAMAARGFLLEGRECIYENDLTPDSIEIALQCVRWLRSAVF